MRRHEIPKTAATDFLFVFVEDDGEVSADCHEFPHDEEDERVMNDGHKLEGKNQQREKPQVPAQGKAALDVMAQIADRVEAPCEREQLKREEKNSERPSNPITTGPAAGSSKRYSTR